jgi:hypothetical protein
MRKRTIIALILSTMLVGAAFVIFYVRPVISNSLPILLTIASGKSNWETVNKTIEHVDIPDAQLNGNRLDYFGMSFVFPHETKVRYQPKPIA